MHKIIILLLLSSLLPLSADMLPQNVLTKSCLESYKKTYLSQKDHKAFVYARESETGKDRCTWADKHDSAQDAINAVMKHCQTFTLNAECKLIDSDGVFKVADGAFNPLKLADDTPLTQSEKDALKKEAKAIILGNCFPFFANKFIEAKGHKSFGYSIDSNGSYACGYSYSNQSKKISKKRALKSCNDNKQKRGKKTPKSACKIYATANKILLKAADFGIKMDTKKDIYLSSEEYSKLLTSAKAIIDEGACLMQMKYYLRGKEHQAYYLAKHDGKQACGRKEGTFTIAAAKDQAKKNCEKMAKKKKIAGKCKLLAKNFELVAKPGDFAVEGIEDFKLAIRKANLIKVKKYIEKGFDINTQTEKDGITPIFIAAIKDDKALFFDLVKKGADIKHVGKDGSNLLLAAAAGGNPSIVHYLINKGLDVNKKGSQGMTPLQGALAGLDTYTARLLILAGADASIPNIEGKTAYEMAKKWKLNLDEMKKLEPNKPVDSDGSLLLFYAAKKGDEAMIEKLFKLGADKDRADKDGFSPISTAKDEQTIKFLIEKGTNINAKADDGNTPLIEMAGFQWMEEVEILLSLGADKTIKNKRGQTAYSLVKDEADVSQELKDRLKP